MNVWELLCDCLPTGELRREASTERSSSMSFCSGAYSQGPLFGLRRKTTLFPWATLLICKYIRSYTHVPFSSFVLQRNITMRAHKDLNNAPDSFNVLLPCSTFRGGGLWLQAPTGDCPSMDDALRGQVHDLTMSGVVFNPHPGARDMPLGRTSYHRRGVCNQGGEDARS